MPNKKAFHRWVAKWSRWLHIYLSMMSLGIIFFFSITGLTLNHPDWFYRETTKQFEGSLNTSWLHLKQSPPSGWNEVDYGHEINKLEVVEYLRSNHRLSGHVSEFLTFEDACEVNFQGPGYASTAQIHRADGTYKLSVTQNDLVSILNDLHKGRHTGPVWSWVIDLSAIISALVALSGFVLIFYLRLNRTRRLVISLIGGLFAIGLMWLAML
jgi:uncharacterized protein